MMDSPVTDLERLRMRKPPRGLPVMRQRWRYLGFLHWPVDPMALVPLLPPGLDLDTYNGKAYLSIVPFTVRGSRPPFLPAIPVASSFHELNLRTYVHRRGRDPGVWFFSLDAASRFAVWGARTAYKLPYFHASMALQTSQEGVVSFSSRRSGRGRQQPRFACSYEPLSTTPVPVPVGTLEFFLIERYLLYSWDARRLRSARVSHRPYLFCPARILDLTENLTESIGVIVEPRMAPIAHYAEEVDVRIYPPSAVRERAGEALPRPAMPARIQEVPSAAP
jgi:uncharacterized protein YqjF (DUF2071 family)